MTAGVVTVCTLAGCGGNTGSGIKAETTTAAVEGKAKTAGEEGDAGDWYMKVLTDPELIGNYSYYKVIDVNKDGNPELILSTTDQAFIGAEDKACLMINDAGEPKVIKEIGEAGGESFYYDENEKLLTCFSRLSGESHLEICQLKDGELKVDKTVDYYAPHHNPEEDTEETIYRVDGADVSENEYNKVWEQYAKEDFAVTYEVIK